MTEPAASVPTAVPAPAVPSRGALGIDPGACYWCLLEGPAARADATARAYEAERWLPVPIEAVQVAQTRIAGGRVLLAAIEHERLRELLAGAPAGLWSAWPRELPPHLADTVPDGACLRLDFLRGAFEAAPRRARRRLALALALVLVLALAVLHLFGAQRRLARIQADTRALQAATTAAYAEAVTRLDSDPGLIPALAVEQELRRLRAAKAGDSGPIPDAQPVLQALWRAWPQDERLQVDSITCDARRIIVRAAAPDLAVAERVVAAWQRVAVPGQDWRLATPELVQEEDRVRLIARLERHDEETRR